MKIKWFKISRENHRIGHGHGHGEEGRKNIYREDILAHAHQVVTVSTTLVCFVTPPLVHCYVFPLLNISSLLTIYSFLALLTFLGRNVPCFYPTTERSFLSVRRESSGCLPATIHVSSFPFMLLCGCSAQRKKGMSMYHVLLI